MTKSLLKANAHNNNKNVNEIAQHIHAHTSAEGAYLYEISVDEWKKKGNKANQA